MGNIQILDCTLRDGAYIVNGNFGVPAIKGIINSLQKANIDIVECGWLKNNIHESGSSYYHTPDDVKQYILNPGSYTTYVVMIDWDRYDLSYLPDYDGTSIDAIRVVFPKDKFREGIAVGREIKKKGYRVFYQAANTLSYSDEELKQLAEEINAVHPEAVSVVDTFGAMYSEDLLRIVQLLDHELDQGIALGFHSHNNQQLSFSLSMQFIEMLSDSTRNCIVDASLCGMGRGAGNTTTELLVNYVNKMKNGNYDMNMIMDAIDMYMGYFTEHYKWGYSTPYFIAGMYCAHVNNIAYLLENHRTNAKDMRNIIGSLSEDNRRKYDYDLLETTYLDYQNKIVDDEQVLADLRSALCGHKILLLSPGRTILTQKDRIDDYINRYQPVVIGINAISTDYRYDYLFFSNKIRYNYAKEIYSSSFESVQKIITSNVKTKAEDNECIVNFNLVIKRGWEHFDNSLITCLRLMNKIHVEDIGIAGFDGFSDSYADSYADISLPCLNPGNKWDELNVEIKDMFDDFVATTKKYMHIEFVTDSIFEQRSSEEKND